MITLAQSPTDPAFVQDPYPFYETARAHGAFFHWQEYDLRCTTSAEVAQAIFRDRRFGREVPAGRRPPPVPHLEAFQAAEAHSLLAIEPPGHTRLRTLVLRAFTGRRIAALRPEIEALAETLLDALPDGAGFDLIPAFATPLPVIVIARLLGVPETMAPDLLAWSHDMVAMYQAKRSHDDEVRAGQAAGAFADFLRGYIAERRARPADDLITHLIAAEDDGARLTTDEMISTLILLLNAGHEATVHTIGNGVNLLLGTGIDRSCLSPDAIAGTVEEIMRLDPPLHLFTRFAMEEVEIAGAMFRPGDEVGLLLAAANRDPAVWNDPAAFRPDRPVRPHLSLGAGIHFCVGAPLARLELQVALPALFRRFPNLSLAAAPAYANLYHFHGLERLLLAPR
jgi:cytochrome P450